MITLQHVIHARQDPLQQRVGRSRGILATIRGTHLQNREPCFRVCERAVQHFLQVVKPTPGRYQAEAVGQDLQLERSVQRQSGLYLTDHPRLSDHRQPCPSPEQVAAAG